MTSNRIPPVPPDKNVPNDKNNPTHRKVEKVEKITKVSEVDENQTRARRFREMVDHQEEPPSEHPTPFTLFASASSAPETTSASGAPAQEPTPSYTGPSVGEEEAESPLPQSRDVWRSIDEPPDTVPPRPSFQETPRSASRIFEQTAAEEKTDGEEQQQGSHEKKATGKKERGAFKESQPFGLRGKPPASMPSASRMAEEKKKVEQGTGPSPAFSPLRSGIAPLAKKEEEIEEKSIEAAAKDRKGDLVSRARELKKEEKEKKTSPETSEKKRGVVAGEARKTDLPRSADRGKEPSAMLPKEEQEERREKKKPLEEAIAAPSLSPLLPEAIPVAQAAATTAAPYLSFDTLRIYFHMIGTIVAMTSPSGDSHTEFILNAPSFANSKFYGATIAIERFSTAPYSLNIRLTGSPEAVTAFNQNIPNLLAAFQRGNFSFGINRIEAAYEKPLFRRKETPRDKGLGKGK